MNVVCSLFILQNALKGKSLHINTMFSVWNTSPYPLANMQVMYVPQLNSNVFVTFSCSSFDPPIP